MLRVRANIERFFAACLLGSCLPLAACGETSSPVEAGNGDGGTGGQSPSGGTKSGTGGIVLIELPDRECDPAVDPRCAAPRIVRDEINGSLPSDATLPPLTRGECGSASEIELVAMGLRDLPSFSFAAMPTEGAPDALYFVHAPKGGTHLAVGRIDKSTCELDAAFREPSDLPSAAATASHLLWRPALGSIDAAFHWDALDGSSSESLPFAGGRPVGANATEVFLSEEGASGPQLSVFEGTQLRPLAKASGNVFRIFGSSALAYTRSGLWSPSSGYWVDLETGERTLLGATDFAKAGFWETAVIFESFLYYCSEGVVRADRSGEPDVRFIDAPCTEVVHADSTGVYWTTPSGLARAALDGSSPTLMAPGGALFDDTHVYFFEEAALLRVKRD